FRPGDPGRLTKNSGLTRLERRGRVRPPLGPRGDGEGSEGQPRGALLMPAPVSRVVFLGLDGGTMAVLAPAFERGWLPNLAALWRRAAFGTLRSSAPMVTPVAWTSFATGCTPPAHGIHEFYYVDPSDRTIR